jgi:hypothetical protein
MKQLIFALLMGLISAAAFAQGGGLPYKQMEKYKGNNMLLTDPVTGQSMIVPFKDHHQIDTFDIVGDTLRISLKGDSVAYKFVILPAASSAEGTVKGTGAANRVAFWVSGDSLSSDANLYWNNTEKRLGLGLTNPAQQLEMTGNLRMVASTATDGNVYKGTDRFIHNFGTRNMYFGIGSGNFTLTGTDNTVFGMYSLSQLTSGNSNNAQGYASLYSLTTGSTNIAQGSFSLYSLTVGNSNVALGSGALRNITTQSENVAAGHLSLYDLTTGSMNFAAGFASGYLITQTGGSIFIGGNTGRQASPTAIGNYNTIIGNESGRALGSGSGNILLGYDLELALPNTSNQLNIGNAIYATGLATGSTPSATGAVGIGTSTPAKQFHTTGTVRLAGLASSTEITAVMIDGNKDLSTRALNSVAFTGEADPAFTTWGYNFNNLTNVPDFLDSIYVDGDTIRLRDGFGAVPLVAGPAGPAGADGTSVTILGSLADEGDLPVSGDSGDAYLIDGDLWVWDGSDWINVGTIQGPAGATGATGPAGPAGDTKWTTSGNNIYNNNTGYVGVNTSTPQAQLDVNGKVRILDVPSSTSDSLLVKEAGIVKYKLVNTEAFLTSETDPLFTAWDKDYDDLINKPVFTAGYGLDLDGNEYQADTTELATKYDLSLIEDTQDLSIDSTGRVFTISLTDGGSVSFQDTDTNTTYSAGTGLSLTGTTFANTSPMVYPGSGIPLSTGSSWGTSITNNSTNWNTAFGWGNHSGLYPPNARTLTINGTSYDLSANRTWSVGTVTSVATGNGITGGTITSTGTLGLTGQALALHNLSSSGMIARTGAGTVAARTITAGTGISVSNGDGVSGNPTITNTGVTSFNGSTGAITYSGLTGSGTATHIPYFSGTSTLASSANMTFATSGSMTITGGSSPFIGGLNLLGSTGSIITMQQSNAQYNLTYGYDLQSQPFYGFYPGNTGFAQSLEIRTYQMYKRFEFNPNSGWMKLYKLTGSTPTQTIELDGQNQKIKLGSTYGATGQAIIVDASGSAVWGTPASTPSEPSPSATKRYNMSEQTISSSSYDYVTLSSSAFTNSFITWSSANNAFQIAYPTGTSYYEINVNANIKGGSSTGAAAYFRIIKMNSSNDHEQIEKIHQYPTSQAWQNININTIMAFSQNQLVRIEAKSVTGQSFIIDNIDVTIKRVY